MSRLPSKNSLDEKLKAALARRGIGSVPFNRGTYNKKGYKKGRTKKHPALVGGDISGTTYSDQYGNAIDTTHSVA